MSHFQFVEENRGAYGVERRCQVLGASRSGYHRWQVADSTGTQLHSLKPLRSCPHLGGKPQQPRPSTLIDRHKPLIAPAHERKSGSLRHAVQGCRSDVRQYRRVTGASLTFHDALIGTETTARYQPLERSALPARSRCE